MKTITLIILSFLFIIPVKAQTEAIPVKTYGLTFSLPWVNSYRYHDYELNTNASKSGFFGLGIGGYCKDGNNKISFGFGFTEDLASPIGAINYEKEGKETHIGCSYGELLFHRPVIDDFGIAAGFNFTGYKFQFSGSPENASRRDKTDNTLGASLGIEYRFNKYISAATFYRPAIASFETDRIYRHMITLDVSVDVNLFKRNR